MSPTTPITRLGEILRAEPPASVSELEPAVVAKLSDAIMAEHRRQEAAIEQAIDDALRIVPRPLRGIVRRILGA